MQVYGTLTLAISIDVPDSVTDEILSIAEKVVNTYNLNLLSLDLPTVNNQIHKASVHDATIEWETAFE